MQLRFVVSDGFSCGLGSGVDDTLCLCLILSNCFNNFEISIVWVGSDALFVG